MLTRDKFYRENERAVLFANILETKEAEDFYHCVNHDGFGRIREFTKFSMHIETELIKHRKFIRINGEGRWSEQYLSQVFQIGVCPLRCRYCFVDRQNLDGTNKNSVFLQPEDIIGMFLETWPDIRNLDLSGGSPDLFPEFLFGLLHEIERVGLKGKITIWSESNLDTRFYSRLSKGMMNYIITFPYFHLLCSLKGWDSESVLYNTQNTMNFEEQVKGIEFFCRKHFPISVYLVFIGNRVATLEDIRKLYVRLKNIDMRLPEWCIPLYIKKFSAQAMEGNLYKDTYGEQKKAAEWWDTLIVNNPST